MQIATNFDIKFVAKPPLKQQASFVGQRLSHTIVCAGKTEVEINAGNLLKQMPARGEPHCIVANTLDEYRKYIEKDPASERRFQAVNVFAVQKLPHIKNTNQSNGKKRFKTK